LNIANLLGTKVGTGCMQGMEIDARDVPAGLLLKVLWGAEHGGSAQDGPGGQPRGVHPNKQFHATWTAFI
jgi:hypothetical protein